MIEGFVPRGDSLLVRLSDPARESKGGIALPDTAARIESEGKVLAVGPDSEDDGPLWFLPDDVILFAQHDFRLLADREGLVHARDVVATVGTDNELLPENDLCLIAPDPVPGESAGGIALPQWGRKTARSGTLLAAGPGLPATSGLLAGHCKPVFAMLNVPREWITSRPRVWWGDDAMALHAAGRVLVRAGHLLFWEEDSQKGHSS